MNFTFDGQAAILELISANELVVRLYNSDTDATICTRWSELTFPTDGSLAAVSLTWSDVTRQDASSTIFADEVIWRNLGSQETIYGYAIYKDTILWTLVQFPIPIVMSTNIKISVKPFITLG